MEYAARTCGRQGVEAAEPEGLDEISVDFYVGSGTPAADTIKAGATSYDRLVSGIIGSSLGTTIHRTVTGITHLGTIMDVYDAGPYYGVPEPIWERDVPSDQIAVDRVRRPAARVQRVSEFG